MNYAEKIVLDIQDMLEGTRIIELSETFVGPYLVAAINERVTKGVYLGGPKQSMGYSTAPIATSMLGRLIREDPGKYSLDARKGFNKTIKLSPDDLIWSNVDGRNLARLRGGYKKFRELSGRRTDLVDLTFTGSMLASLRHNVRASAGVVTVTVAVSAMNMHKAYYTDLSREWMGATDKELAFIERRLSELLG